MKALRTTVFVLALSLASCFTAKKEWEDRAIRNNWSGDHIRNASVEAAILRESTLYAHHFVIGSAKLTPLGARDLGILSKHFKEAPGALIVKRGEASDELFEARLKTVSDGLLAAGVDGERFTVSDGRPGGPGMSSEQLIEILMQEDDASQSESLITTSSGSN